MQLHRRAASTSRSNITERNKNMVRRTHPFLMVRIFKEAQFTYQLPKHNDNNKANNHLLIMKIKPLSRFHDLNYARYTLAGNLI